MNDNKNLKPCRTCNELVSKSAKTCPHCGQKKPVKKNTPLWQWCLVLFVIMWFVGKHPTESTVSPSSTVEKNMQELAVIKANTRLEPQAPSWHIHKNTSEMDDSKTIQMSLRADNSVNVWLDKKTPTLKIRCRENKTDIILDAKTNFHVEHGLYNKSTVRIRIDDAPAFKQTWGQSTDGEALFARKPIALGKKLYTGKKLRVEFTPFNAAPVTANFNFDGIDEYLPQVSGTCGWTLK